MFAAVVVAALVALANAQLSESNVDSALYGSAAEVKPWSSAQCVSGQIEGAGGECSDVAACQAQYFLETVDMVETQAPTSLEPGRVIGTNSVEIVVQHPAVKGRQVTKIELSQLDACNYPGPNWKKGYQTDVKYTEDGQTTTVCRDVYASSIPWGTAYKNGGDMDVQLAEACGLERTQNATHVSFLGKGTVFYNDTLGVLDGVPVPDRQVASVVQFEIVQPRIIRDISTTVRIIDEPRLLSAVTRQLYDFNTNEVTLTLLLSMAAPLRTVSEEIVSIGADGLTVTQLGEVNNDNCGNTKDSVCQQSYDYTIALNELCEFDGDYAFSFGVDCHPGVAAIDCPEGSTERTMNMTIALDGENVCEVISGLLEVEGSMTSHGTFDKEGFVFGEEKKAFFQDQTVHFQVQVESLNGFPYESSEIIEIDLELKDETRASIYNKAENGAQDGWQVEINSNAATNNVVGTDLIHYHHFSFLPEADKFGDVERNQPKNSSVLCSVEIVFENSIGPDAGKKRAIKEYRFHGDGRARQAVNNVAVSEVPGSFIVEAGEPGTGMGGSEITGTGDPTGEMDSDKSEDDSAASTIVLSTAALAAAALTL